MITEIRIKDYRLLKDVRVPLRPLTVLVGENDSGKTSFLRAIQFFVSKGAWAPDQVWQGHPDGRMAVTIFWSGGEGTWGVTQTERFTKANHQQISGELRKLVFVELPRAGPPMQGTAVADVEGPPALGGAGDGVPALLDHLQRRDRRRFDAFVRAAGGHIPGLQDITLTAVSESDRQVRLHLEGGFQMDAGQASSGVRVMLFFLALAYHPSPPPLILVEEPETSVHPKRLKQVVELLRALTKGEHGDTAAQVILTTHSPHLLDHVDLEQDQVLVFRRAEDGSALVGSADAERLKAFLDEFTLGELWFNRQEAGLVSRSAAAPASAQR